MKIEKFWIVTKPTAVSTMQDICFQSDIHGLQLQFLGGLKSENIHGIYTKEAEAKQEAEKLLQ